MLNKTTVEIAALLRRCLRLRMKTERMCSQAERMAEAIEKEKRRLAGLQKIQRGAEEAEKSPEPPK